MTKIQSSDNAEHWQRYRETSSLTHCWWKTAWQFLQKLNMQLPYDPAVVLLGTYSREMKIFLPTNPYLNVDTSCICDRPKLESTRVSFNRGMANQRGAPTLEYYLVFTRNQP